MKKVCLILSLCLLLSLLGGCADQQGTAEPAETTEPLPLVEVTPAEGELLSPDTEGLKKYKLDCGLTFYGPRGLEEDEIDGLAGYLSGTYYVVMIIREPRAGTVLENVTLEEYAEMLAESNSLNPFVVDSYGSLATTYMAESFEFSGTFFYYTTVREGEDCFWLIQITCPDDLAQKNAGEMARWSATFTETK